MPSAKFDDLELRSVDMEDLRREGTSTDGPPQVALSPPGIIDLGPTDHRKSFVPSPSAASPLQEAVVNRASILVVQRLVEARADLNGRFSFGSDYGCIGSAIAAAAMIGANEVVRILFDSGASLTTIFGWKAGLFGTWWEGPVVFASVVGGHLHTLRLLATLKAALDGRLASLDGQPNGTLLYESSCRGFISIVKALAKRNADLNVPVRHTHDPSLQVTPLHSAAFSGNCEVARALIAARADLSLRDRTDGTGATALVEAIDNGQYEVARLLVEKGADLFTSDEQGESAMKRVFTKNNMVTIAAVAEGLQLADEHEVAKLSVQDLVKFLTTPGDAPKLILGALFRCRKLRHWKHAKAIEWKTATISRTENINAAVGPRASYFEDRFDDARQSKCKLDRSYIQPIAPAEQKFLDTLLPQSTRGRRTQTIQVPINIAQCLLPGIHRESQVLLAIANGPSAAIFDELGCQAILLLGWQYVARQYIIGFVVVLLQAICFLCISFQLNESKQAETKVFWLAMNAVLWLLNAFSEIFELIGFYKLGLLSYYLCDWNNLLDALRLALTGMSILVLVLFWDRLTEEATDIEGIHLLLAAAAFFRWTKLLNSCCAFKSVGPQMLPILNAVNDIYPFLTVVLFPILGFAHAFYLLSSDTSTLASQSVAAMYRLSFMGDIGRVEEHGGLLGDYLEPLLMITTLSMGTVMMNIFIGVLCESYNRAFDQRERIFLERRSHIILCMTAKRIALDSLFPRLRFTSGEKSLMTDGSHDNTNVSDYVWYARRSQQADDDYDLNDWTVDNLEMESDEPPVSAEVAAMQTGLDCANKRLERLEQMMRGLAQGTGIILKELRKRGGYAESGEEVLASLHGPGGDELFNVWEQKYCF